MFDFDVPGHDSYPIHITDGKNIYIDTTIAVETHPDLIASSTGGRINKQRYSIVEPIELVKKLIESEDSHENWINLLKTLKNPSVGMEKLYNELKGLDKSLHHTEIFKIIFSKSLKFNIISSIGKRYESQ
jgi:hypothetical protein